MVTPLKYLYNKDYIQLLCTNIQKHDASFDVASFRNAVFDSFWEEKELKQRMRHIAITLCTFLEKSFSESIKVLKNTFLEMNTQNALENMLFQDFVEVYGLDDFETSMNALECFTIGSSSEFAIRRFIIKYPEQAIKQLLVWAKDENEHLRRLASEGCRPRLPWSIALPAFKKDPSVILPILEMLKGDSSLYVRKSVANNLNDISKDNPDILKSITQRWMGKAKECDWILKHACRTLLKNSDKEVLALFGYKENKNISLQNFEINSNISQTNNLNFNFSLYSTQALGKMRLEFSIDFLRQGAKHNTKVFKICEADYKESFKHIAKSFSFKPISTRKYYKGLHFLRILINGIVVKEVEFTLK